MVSDDTEHACMTLQALIESGGDVDPFQRSLARRFRWWLLGLPAGIGKASLLAILKLWIGIPPGRSGVWSGGQWSGHAAAILGAAIEVQAKLREFVKASTRITHTDPKAEWGAWAIALAARLAASGEVAGDQYLESLQNSLPPEAAGLIELIESAVASVRKGESTEAFANSQGWKNGISGYVYQTVPIAIHAWLRYPADFRAAVMAVVRCGGDLDTTGAIVGGIVGAAVFKSGIPSPWLHGLMDWPRTVAWMEQLGCDIEEPAEVDLSKRAPGLAFVASVPRNALFLVVVLFHGPRRCLPPW